MRLLLPAFVTIGLFASCGIQAEQQPIKVNFNHVDADNTPKDQGASLFKKLVEGD